MEQEVWYMVQQLEMWTSLETNLGFSMSPRQFGSVGFIPVFDSIEAAVNWKDEQGSTAPIVTIARTQPQQEERN